MLLGSESDVVARVMRLSVRFSTLIAIMVALSGRVTVLDAQEVQAVVEDEWAAPANDPLNLLLARYLRVESELLKRCCKLSEDQTDALTELEGDWIEEQIKLQRKEPNEGAIAGLARFLGDRLVRPGGGRMQQPHAIAQGVQVAIDKQLLSILTSEQKEKFEQEKRSRSEFKRESLAKCLVVVLDRELFLDDGQIESLEAIIYEWLGEKDLYWQFYFQSNRQIPKLPDHKLRKVLNEDQMKALSAKSRWDYSYDEMMLQMIPHQDLPLVAK